MKLSANFLYVFATLIAVAPARVAAGDGDGDGDNKVYGVGDSNRKPKHPRPSPLYHDRPYRPDYPDHPDQPYDGKPDDGRHSDNKSWNHGYRGTQVLWGQCGGYHYYGIKKCPEGSYCRYFSEWYSQCNPNNT